MAAPRLVRVQSLLAKIETTEGSDISPATANAIRPAGPLALELGAEVQNLRSDTITEVLGKLGPLPPGAKWARLTIPVQVRGFGSAYSASNLPEVDVLLRICALSQTVVTTGGSESVTYELRTTGQESATIYFYEDGKLAKMLGCRGTLTVSAPAGQPLVFTFTVSGIYVARTDTSLVAGTYQSSTPALFRGASSLAYNSVSLIGRSYSADLGNQVASRLNANATDALAGFHVTDRNPTASFVCEDPLVATADFEGDWVAATARVLDILVAPPASPQYNRCKIHHDKFTPSPAPTFGDDNGMRLATVNGIVSVEGTEDFAIIFD